MDFDDLETAEAEDEAEIVPPRHYFDFPAQKEEEEEADVPEGSKVEATVEGLAKALTEERQQRRRLEKELVMLRKQMEGMRLRVGESPGLWQLQRRTPEIHPSAYVAPGATVIGSVKLGRDASVWFNCTIRGDNEQITIGDGTDIQDNSILHCDPGKPLTIGKHVLVGHQVCLHGCTVGDTCLIGMRTTMLDNSRVGNNCFVAAGSFIGENKVFPDNSVIGGNPAKKISDIEGPMLTTVKHAWESYVENKDRYSRFLKPY
mmetsp:Transcript_92943/g.216024  ORF Transcript_92943/g.216024 Transcript_92943/m.216024 type:complete len:260 (-) Transcript_92943:94-873(-)